MDLKNLATIYLAKIAPLLNIVDGASCKAPNKGVVENEVSIKIFNLTF